MHAQAHHGEVIVGVCTVAMFLNFCSQGLYYLLGCFKVSIAQDREQTVIAKLLVLAVFGLVQSVGIEEQCTGGFRPRSIRRYRGTVHGP